MEAIGAASSIAGLVGLAGQCVSGIITLKNFYSDMASACTTISHFLRDLNALLTALSQVEEVCRKITDPVSNFVISPLYIHLEDCKKDVFKWLETARDLRPACDKGRRAWFKKFWVAGNQNAVDSIRREISRHQHGIALNLLILGRNMDQQLQETVQGLVDHAKKSQVSSESSFSSIASSLSRVEDLIAGSNDPPQYFAHSPETSSEKSPYYKRLYAANYESDDSPRALSLAIGQSSDTSDETYSDAFRPRQTWTCSALIRNYKTLYLTQVEIYSSNGVGRKALFHEAERQCCGLCGESFPGYLTTDWAARFNHMISHHKLKLFHGCLDLQFRNSAAFMDHMRIGHGMTYPDPRSIVVIEELCRTNQYPVDGAVFPETTVGTGPFPPSHFSATYENIMQLLEASNPPLVTHYIKVRGLHSLYKTQLALLEPRLSAFDGISRCYGMGLMLHSQGLMLKQYQTELQTELESIRLQCLKAGISLYDIDQAAIPQSSQFQPADSNHNTHNDMLEMRRNTLEGSLLDNFSSTRDRINRWLLHSLRSDDKLARLHRSFLPDSTLANESWARLVLKYWNLDEAAVGEELLASFSISARYSFGANSLVGSVEGASPFMMTSSPVESVVAPEMWRDRDRLAVSLRKLEESPIIAGLLEPSPPCHGSNKGFNGSAPPPPPLPEMPSTP